MKLIIGTMNWGEWGSRFSTNQVADFLTKLVENGFLNYDLADIYGGYTTEKLFGDGLKLSGLNRNQLFLISKCGIQYPSANSIHKTKSYNTSCSYILNQVERSLNEIQTDYLDLLLIHRPDPLMNIYEIGEAFNILKSEKKVLKFGVSNFLPYEFELLNKHFPLYTNQVELSLSRPENLFNGTLLQANELQFQPQIWSPLGDIWKHENEKSYQIKIKLNELAIKYQATENDILIAWVRKHPSNPIPILGSTKIERILSLNLTIELETEDWYELLEISRGHRVA